VLYPDNGHGIADHRPEMLEKLYRWSSELLIAGDGAQTGEA
jgi:hypothetical protein